MFTADVPFLDGVYLNAGVFKTTSLEGVSYVRAAPSSGPEDAP